MKFTPNQDLLDGEDRYQAGVEVDVPEDRARYFVSHGWGTAQGLPAELGDWSEPAHVMLQPDDVTGSQGSEVG